MKTYTLDAKGATVLDSSLYPSALLISTGLSMIKKEVRVVKAKKRIRRLRNHDSGLANDAVTDGRSKGEAGLPMK